MSPVTWFRGLSVAAKLGVAAGVVLALVVAATLLVRAVSARDERIRQAGRDEVQAAWNAERGAREKARADVQVALTAAMTPLFDGLSRRVGEIDARNADISVRLPQSIAAAPRYADPNCSLTARVLEQVNAARALSAEPTP